MSFETPRTGYHPLSWKRPLMGVLLLTAALTASACVPALRSTPSPIPTVRHHAGGDASDCLVVLLPGRGGGMHDFRKAGFLDAATEARVPADLLAVDAHFGYYRKRSLITRLQEDVVEPARAGGTDRLWLVGVSMGGMSSLLYSRARPADVAGMVLFSPYLGEGEVIDEIRRAGGLRAWTPPDAVELETDFERALWQWLKWNDASDHGIPIYLGYAAQEEFASANELLADVLPSERLVVRDGGHTWTTWTPIWKRFVESGILCTP